MSAYKIETWTKRGFTEEEAKYQIAIRRPSNILYWMNKFNLSEVEARIKMVEHQSSTAKSNVKTIEERRKLSPRCAEYWIEKGYVLDEAKLMVSDAQTTFSLEKCIEKYGHEKGHMIWLERQKNGKKQLILKLQKK